MFHFTVVQTNTFQCMLATDGVRSFTIFLYLDEGIQWGEGAQIGLDAVQTSFSSVIVDFNLCPLYLSLPGALQESSVDIESASNTGTPGKYGFRLDTVVVIEAGRKYDHQNVGKPR